ncbi:MFS transporter [Pararhodobacter sp.]|uniref:MFS transporter n=1 Tax=Pararhodobacter sp. TaxID=2127056 RepID=UPI002AFF218A|nr:MFS transporter [Pararhodobacter sp.]
MSFPLAGWLSDRIGGAKASRAVGVVYALVLPMIALAPNVWLLAVALTAFGACHGAMDVTMNTWAAEVERHAKRPIMASFHAMWSLGAGLGASSGWLAVAGGLSPLMHFALGAGVSAAVTLWLAQVPWQSVTSPSKVGFALPPRPLVPVGLVAFCSSVGEGAMADWGALFLTLVSGASEATAALGYGVYSAAMVVARLLGYRVIEALGPVTTARLGGACAALGVLVALIGASVVAGMIGFALLGVGYAVMIPLAISRAANEPGVSPGRAIAGVATLGYGGMLLGPVMIGAVAQVTSLGTGFGVLAVLAAAIIGLAGAMRPRAS